uniref:Uncharacterized protein n=1 Tax=Acrobeloides nanus TaxID=290746 RepID=A0A914CRT8_9BILA
MENNMKEIVLLLAFIIFPNLKACDPDVCCDPDQCSSSCGGDCLGNICYCPPPACDPNDCAGSCITSTGCGICVDETCTCIQCQTYPWTIPQTTQQIITAPTCQDKISECGQYLLQCKDPKYSKKHKWIFNFIYTFFRRFDVQKLPIYL